MADKNERRRRLVEKFRSIAQDRVDTITAAISGLETTPGDQTLVEQVVREAHTLKGEAKMMGFDAVNLVMHRAEDLILAAKKRGFDVPHTFVALILEGMDGIGTLLDPERTDAMRPDDYARKVAAMLETPLPERAQPTRREPDVEPAAMARSVDTIRVSLSRLDELTEVAQNLLLGHFRLARALEHAGVASTQAEAGKRDALFENKTRVDELQSRVRALRLLPITSLFRQYPEAIRRLGREQGKNVRADVWGAQVELDKGVLDLIGEPLLHLVRNCVDHGIESPKERAAAGKNEVGVVRLSAAHRGSAVEIMVADDGRGLDPDTIREAAVRRGMLTRAAADRLDAQEATALIFRPGFSTRQQVTDVSGRGVGMDIVKHRIEGLGGTVDVESTPGAGTVFRLTVPTSLVVMRAMAVQVGRAICAIPSESVSCVLTVSRSELRPAGSGLTMDVEGVPVRVAHLAAILGLEHDDVTPAQESPVVVLGHRGRRLGLVVDAHLGEREVVQRAVDPFLGGIRVMNGTAVLEDGRMAVLLNAAEIMDLAGQGGAKWRISTLSAPTVATVDERVVLVVDDSEIIRDLVVGVLRRERWEVLEAVDGRDALRRLAERRPALIITDLEMPVMDGFQLIERVRADAALADVPMIVFSTRGSESDRKRASEAGADAYLVKSTFEEHELIATVERFGTGGRR